MKRKNSQDKEKIKGELKGKVKDVVGEIKGRLLEVEGKIKGKHSKE